MQNTRDVVLAAGMGLTIAQTPILIIMMMYLPEPRATLYTVHNGTTVDSVAVDTGAIYLTASVLISLFAVITHQLREGSNQMLDNMLEFNEENVRPTGMWSVVLWTAFAFCHAVVVMAVSSPLSHEFLLLMVGAYLVAVVSLCSPHERSQADVLLLALYIYAVSQVYRPVHGALMAAFVLQSVADLLLVMGHTYDPCPNMMTVGNCRHVHVALSSAALLILYGGHR